MFRISLGRRSMIGLCVAALTVAITAIGAPGARAEQKKISFLTWNISDQKELFEQWMADFKKLHPDVDIEWLDKKGTEFPAYYQTQVMAGTPPDIVDIQGALWIEYAAAGGLVDLTPYIDKEADMRRRFNPDYLVSWTLDKKNFLLPFYVNKTVLMYNKTMFKEAGIKGPPETFEQMMDYANRMARNDKTGLILMNWDWLYWPLFKMNGVELLTPDLRKAAFNTPKAVAVLEALASATKTGGINKIAWTGRWVEPNGAFASGNVGMMMANASAYFFVRGQAPWLTPETFGVAQTPGNWAAPNLHGWGISKASKYPDLAWEFIKMATSDTQAAHVGERRKLMTGNIAADKATMDKLSKNDPAAAAVLQTQMEFTDKLTGNWTLPNDARVKEAFYPEIQNAVLGRKTAAQALKDAEIKVNRLLSR